MRGRSGGRLGLIRGDVFPAGLAIPALPRPLFSAPTPPALNSPIFRSRSGVEFDLRFDEGSSPVKISVMPLAGDESAAAWMVCSTAVQLVQDILCRQPNKQTFVSSNRHLKPHKIKRQAVMNVREHTNGATKYRQCNECAYVRSNFSSASSPGVDICGG